jgi:RNA polymerase sigma-70 factor (ECF subfamily)
LTRLRGDRYATLGFRFFRITWMSDRPHVTSTLPADPALSVQDSAQTEDFLAVYEEHARPLLAWLSTRVPRSDLEDVHQEIWTKVWAKKRESFKGGNFRAWLFTVARNHLVDRHEKKPATPLMQDPDEAHVDARQATPWAIAIDRERHEVLIRCLAVLGDVRRQVVQMRLAGGDYDTISAKLGISAAQAHSHFFAAKRQLRELLEEA